jgi:hypothetical protein
MEYKPVSGENKRYNKLILPAWKEFARVLDSSPFGMRK